MPMSLITICACCPRSVYCRHEFMAAVKYRKRIVVVLEVDPIHGGVPLSAHIDEAERHAATDDGMAAVLEVLRRHEEQGWIVPWHRIRAFQDLSLQLILAPIVCLDDGKTDEVETREGKLVFIPTQLCRRPLRPLPQACHLYISPNNPRAKEVAEQMAKLQDEKAAQRSWAGLSNRQQLNWTHDAGEAAQRFLLFLDSSTWDREKNPHAAELSE